MKRIAMIAAGSLIGLLPSIASARTHFSFGFNFGFPFFGFPPVCVAPPVTYCAPVYASPAPVCAAPTVTYAPAPAYYYAPPVVYAPAPVYVSSTYYAPPVRFYFGDGYSPRYYGGYGHDYYRGGYTYRH